MLCEIVIVLFEVTVISVLLQGIRIMRGYYCAGMVPEFFKVLGEIHEIDGIAGYCCIVIVPKFSKTM